MWNFMTSILGAAVFLVLLSLQPAGAADESPGKRIFLKNKCTQCHTVQALGLAKSEDDEEEEEGEEDEEEREPPDLSGVGKKHDAEWMAKFVTKKIRTDEGRKHKKKWKGGEEDLKVLTEWLATLKHDVPEEKE